MAFDIKGLSRMIHCGGLTGCSHWRYDTLDATTDVDGAGYFNDAAGILRVGDVIDRVTWATAIGTGTISTYGRHIVNANSGTVVDTSDTTAGTVTDSD